VRAFALVAVSIAIIFGLGQCCFGKMDTYPPLAMGMPAQPGVVNFGFVMFFRS